MEEVEFQIFIPDGKKIHLTPNLIIFGAWFLTIGLFWFLNGSVYINSNFLTAIAFLVFGGSICFLLLSFFMYKPLNGVLRGEIIFEDDKIVVDEKTYKLTEISNIDFFFGDCYGQRSTSGRDFDAKLYQGVNNYITFADNGGNIQTIYFQLLTEHNHQDLSPFINAAIKVKKMAFKRGIDLLGIENVSIES